MSWLRYSACPGKNSDPRLPQIAKSIHEVTFAVWACVAESAGCDAINGFSLSTRI